MHFLIIEVTHGEIVGKGHEMAAGNANCDVAAAASRTTRSMAEGSRYTSLSVTQPIRVPCATHFRSSGFSLHPQLNGASEISPKRFFTWATPDASAARR
jgi:hypothetical protein